MDYLSIDIEGAELYGLKGFDIQRYEPELCCVVFSIYLDEESRKGVLEYFESNGYETIEKYRKVDKINRYFRRKSGV